MFPAAMRPKGRCAVEESKNENKAAISARHRAEWRAFREGILAEVRDTRDMEAAKFAKACADILKVYQEGERKAWGFAEGEDAAEAEYVWDGE